jgi:SAM-dependent methyltransferase
MIETGFGQEKIKPKNEKITLCQDLEDLEWSYRELDEVDDKDFSNAIVWTKEREIRLIKDKIRDQRFWNFCVTTVGESGYEPPQGRKTKVLDLACGIFEEAGTITSYFGGSIGPNIHNNNVDIIAVESDERMIDPAKENIPHDIKNNYKVLLADATKLEDNSDVPDLFDVILIRHQQMFKSINPKERKQTELTWQEIMRQGINKLADNGIFIITSYTEDEHEGLLNFLEDEECKIINAGENEFAEPLGGGGIDKYVVVLKKGLAV